MPLNWKERERRCLSQDRPASQLIRRCFESFSVHLQNCTGVIQGVHNKPRQDSWPDFVKLKFESGNNAPKLPPPPRSAQNESGFSVRLARTNSPPAVTTSADRRLSDRQTEFSRDPAEPAAECQTGNSRS